IGVQPKRAPPRHQQRARYAVASCCRRYRPGRLQALQDDPELLVIRPAPTPPSLNKLQPFNLSTVLMAVHKHCYTSLKPTKQGGPRRRETPLRTNHSRSITHLSNQNLPSTA